MVTILDKYVAIILINCCLALIHFIQTSLAGYRQLIAKRYSSKAINSDLHCVRLGVVVKVVIKTHIYIRFLNDSPYVNVNTSAKVYGLTIFSPVTAEWSISSSSLKSTSACIHPNVTSTFSLFFKTNFVFEYLALQVLEVTHSWI